MHKRALRQYHSPMEWHLRSYAELSADQVYDLLAARVEVFVVEQQCPYQDVDGRDRQALHCWAEDRRGVLAYGRITAPGVRFIEPSIGRVITTQAGRGQGLGRELMQRCIQACQQHWPDQAIRISAQQYLERFYASLGFVSVHGPYLEDDIPHMEMLRHDGAASS